MKKTYINPNIKVVKIATRQMLADSLMQSSTPASVSGTGDQREYVNGLGRGFDFDDEEE